MTTRSKPSAKSAGIEQAARKNVAYQLVRTPSSEAAKARAVGGRAERAAVSIDAVNANKAAVGGSDPLRQPGVATEPLTPNSVGLLVDTATRKRMLARQHFVEDDAQ